MQFKRGPQWPPLRRNTPHDRKSAELLVRIKRNLPNQIREEFRITAPNIEDIVFDLYVTSTEKNLRDLSRRFLLEMDPNWNAAIQQHDLLQQLNSTNGNGKSIFAKWVSTLLPSSEFRP